MASLRTVPIDGVRVPPAVQRRVRRAVTKALRPKRPKPLFPAGTPVVRVHQAGGTNRTLREYGIVVESFWDGTMKCWDYHVAFFGYRPVKRGYRKLPYVLRYYESSLERWERE